jgi:DNA polymerase (family 10)
MVIELRKCQLDLWFADEQTLATRLLCRTGSMQHNIWLAETFKKRGQKWNPYEGVLTGGTWWKSPGDGHEEYQGGTLRRFGSEEEIYQFAGLDFIPPEKREPENLPK